MTPLVGTSVLADALVALALFLCSAGQVVHGYLRTSRAPRSARAATAVYEAALLAHLLVMAAFVADSIGGRPDPGLAFYGFEIPLAPALWANVAVVAVAVYAALANVGAEDELAAIEDPAWMPGVEAVVVCLCIPPFISLLDDAWPVALYADAAYFAFRTTYLVLVDARMRRRVVSELSIAEAVKLLPEGILYADGKGRTLVANDAMRHCLSALGLSTEFARVDRLWVKLGELAGEGGPNTVSVAATVEREPGTWVVVKVAPDEVRLFSFEGAGFDQERRYPSGRALWDVGDDPAQARVSKRLLGGTPASRVIAYDVTQEVDILQAIDRTNAELAESQQELRAALRTVQEAAENEAMLRMRGRVHDVIGQRLSMLHRALEDDAVSDEQLEALKPLLNGILDDLAADVRIAPSDELTATVDAFALTGVAVEVDGALPEDEARAKLFADCIREAATNAVKHAHATRLDVSVSPDGRKLTVVNDGTPAEPPIVEGTGLANMRRAVESAGGSLRVVPEGAFTLTVDLP